MVDPIIRTLIAWRLRWWGVISARAAQRHWQWFVLAAVFVPMGTPLRALLIALAYPLLQAFEPGHGIAWHVWRVVAIQAVFTLWVVMQWQAIRGGHMRDHLQTLPLTLTCRRLADLAVLVPVNTVLTVPFVAGALLASTEGHPDRVVNSLAMTLVALLCLLAQLVLLERRLLSFVFILAADIALGGALVTSSLLALGGALCLGLLALAPIPRSRVLRRRRESKPDHSLLQLLPPAIRIQCRALVGQPTSWLRALSLAAIVLGANFLYTVFEFDGRTWPTAALALAALALVTAGWYRPLAAAHAPVARYAAALPLHRRFWLKQDLRFILGLSAIPAAGVLIALALQTADSLLSTVWLMLGYWALVALLRWPLLAGGRQATVLATLMAGAWSVAAVASTLH